MPEYTAAFDEMPRSGSKLYCGPPSARLAQIFGIGASQGIGSWLCDFRTYYVHLGRVAIHRACEILNIGQGDEILAPAYNCGSEIDPLLRSAASLKLYRIDRSARIDLNDLKNRISKQTKAVYVTHYFGMPQPIAEIKSICGKRIYLIEDCALSLFSCDLDKKLGSFGDISIFSFPKTLPVPDGGAMVINNPDLSQHVWVRTKPSIMALKRKLLSLGKRRLLYMSSEWDLCYSTLWPLLQKARFKANDSCESDTSLPDMPSSFYYDERLDNRDISAITDRMLRTFDPGEIISKRRQNFVRYLELMSSNGDVKPLYDELPDGVCPLHFPVFVPEREKVCRELNALSIDATAWWSGYHRSLPWREYPDACFLKDHLLALPVHQNLSIKHIETICETLTEILNKMPASRSENHDFAERQSYAGTRRT